MLQVNQKMCHMSQKIEEHEMKKKSFLEDICKDGHLYLHCHTLLSAAMPTNVCEKQNEYILNKQ